MMNIVDVKGPHFYTKDADQKMIRFVFLINELLFSVFFLDGEILQLNLFK